MADFVSRYRLPVIETYNSLHFFRGRVIWNSRKRSIILPGCISLSRRDDLYKFQVANESFDRFIKLLLRSYTGMFTEFVAINEDTLARKSAISQGYRLSVPC